MMAQLQKGALFANRFEIDRTAGAGGMGVVYRARDCLSDQIVALKVLNSPSSDHQEVDRFSREVQILSELRHPGIVGYVCHGQSASGQSYLAMEWLDGEDLASRLVTLGVTLGESFVCMRAAAAGLGQRVEQQRDGPERDGHHRHPQRPRVDGELVPPADDPLEHQEGSTKGQGRPLSSSRTSARPARTCAMVAR